MNKRGDLSAGDSRSRGAVGPPVVLVGSVIVLFGTLATFLILRLRESNPGVWLLESWFGDYLLLLAFALAVFTPLALIAVALVALLSATGSPRGAPLVAPLDSPAPVDASLGPTGDGATLENTSWTNLVEECVDVVDELDRHMAGFDAPRRELAGHVILRLQEILGRSGVEVISGEVTYDRSRHRPERAGTTISNGALITETLSPGFAVGRRVLRRARVRVPATRS